MEICRFSTVVASLDIVDTMVKGSIPDHQYHVLVKFGNAVAVVIVKLNSC
jgi:hypothetical protein